MHGHTKLALVSKSSPDSNWIKLNEKITEEITSSVLIKSNYCKTDLNDF